MLDKLIAMVFSVITFFMSVFGTSFLEVKPLEDKKSPAIAATYSLHTMSYNIKSGGSGKQSPENRIEAIKKIINDNAPQVLGIQEATPFWMEQLPEIFGDKYEMVGVGRSDDESSEANPILYLKDKYNLLDSGTFWLSDTPEIPSNTWGAAFNRICTYVVLEDKETGFKFAQFNTHFDHRGEKARQNSVDVITEKIDAVAADLPVVLLGDFNVDEGSTVYNKVISSGMKDAKKIAAQVDGGKTGRSYHGYNALNYTFSGSPIDFVFVNDKIKSVESYKIDNSKVDGIYPSDHYPLICDITLSLPLPADSCKTQDITAMTYNVYIMGTGESSPEARTPYVISNIRNANPDSFGLEEADEGWVERIAAGMPEYAYVGHGRDKDLGGEASPIFYLKDKYELVKSGTFWLSKTPDKPSRGWDAMFNRICTYAVLKDKETGFTYAHFNAHFDHLGVIARINSVAVINSKINELCPDMPLVFSGDLNDSEGSDMYYRILASGFKDTKTQAEETMDCATYHGYSEATEASRPEPIDFVFVNAYAAKVKSYTVDKTQHNGIYASDHHPVIAKISFAY